MADHSERWVLNRLIEMCRDDDQSLTYLADRIKYPACGRCLGGLADRRASFAQELAARVVFEYLDAPVRRVGAMDTPVADCPDLEEYTQSTVSTVSVR